MKPESLNNIKKELKTLSAAELVEVCLRMAKYKKENKELLNYLLFDANDPLNYAEQLKQLLNEDFQSLQKHYYYSTKSLRKILRMISRHTKYTASKQVELEMLLWFCKQYLEYADLRTSHKALQGLLIRQLEKISKLLPKLHEDLQFDYNNEFADLLEQANSRTTWVKKSFTV